MKPPKGRKTFNVLSFYAERLGNPNYLYVWRDCGSRERARQVLKGYKGVKAAYFSEYIGERMVRSERLRF